MEIIEYFNSHKKQYWLEKINQSDWNAGKKLGELIKNNQFFDLLGETSHLLMLVDNNDLISFVTFSLKDCIDDKMLFPWIGFVYTFPKYRGNRFAEKLMNYAVELAKNTGYKNVYIATDHIGLYEKYGFNYLTNKLDIYGEDSRIYVRNTIETKVKFYEKISDHLLKFAVIIAKYKGKYIFCKHKDRTTLEIPGGHRENEDIITTAMRELYEETGAIDYELKPVCVYSVTAKNNFDGEETFGMLYYANVLKFESKLFNEIEKIELLSSFPSYWTYPTIQPQLLQEAIRRKIC